MRLLFLELRNYFFYPMLLCRSFVNLLMDTSSGAFTSATIYRVCHTLRESHMASGQISVRCWQDQLNYFTETGILGNWGVIINWGLRITANNRKLVYFFSYHL